MGVEQEIEQEDDSMTRLAMRIYRKRSLRIVCACADKFSKSSFSVTTCRISLTYKAATTVKLKALIRLFLFFSWFVRRTKRVMDNGGGRRMAMFDHAEINAKAAHKALQRNLGRKTKVKPAPSSPSRSPTTMPP